MYEHQPLGNKAPIQPGDARRLGDQAGPRTRIGASRFAAPLLFAICTMVALSDGQQIAPAPSVAAGRPVQLPQGEPPRPQGKRVNVVDFGAKPADDDHDDTAAVNAALRAAGDRATLYFPAGTYNVRWVDKIAGRNGLSLEGDGPARSILKRAGPFWKPGAEPTWANLQANYSTDAKLLRIEDCRDMCIRNLGFDAGGTPTFGGVGVLRPQRLCIANTRFFDSGEQPPFFGRDRFAWVVLGFDQGAADIWFTDNAVEGLQTEMDGVRRVLVERCVFKRPVKSAGLCFLSANFSKPEQLAPGFHNGHVTVRRNYFSNAADTSMGMLAFQTDPPTNCGARFHDVAVVDNVFAYDIDSPKGHCAIKLGAGDNSVKTTGNRFDRFRIEGNRIYRGPQAKVNERYPAYIWFNARMGEERLHDSVVRGNRLLAAGETKPLVLIQCSEESKGLVVEANAVEPYQAPPPLGESPPATPRLDLRLRSRVKTPAHPQWTPVEKAAQWDPKKTALVICDMWDDHWCKSAAARVGEMAGPMNVVVRTARARGVFIIHAPSSVTAFYRDTPQRKLAAGAPNAATPVPLATAPRWGTAWCWPDAKREAVLPIDDSDMGCDCAVKCTIREAWTRQIATIELAPGDALTDNGQETWNLLAQRGIDNVILCGVHLNMCVLGRPFGIRQMVRLGKNVALMRDMTDTMYNPERPPGVTHFEGTNMVVEHVEKHWCPSFTSSDITGKPAFRFKADSRSADSR